MVSLLIPERKGEYLLSMKSSHNFLTNIKKFVNIFAKLPNKFDLCLFLTTIALVVFGSLMIVSTKAGSSVGFIALFKVIVKQLVFVVASYILMCFFANKFSMKKAKKYHLYIGIFIVILLAITLGQTSVLGSRAWIRIPIPFFNITLQPAEFAKVFMIIVMAIYVESNVNRNTSVLKIIGVPLLFYIIFTIIIILQPDFGTLLILGFITLTCFFIPSHKKLRKLQRVFACLLPIGLCVLIYFCTPSGLATTEKIATKIPSISHFSYRIEGAIDPFLHPKGSAGYQVINGLYGFAHGGLGGVGLGESVQKYGYLTQSDNDFILSIVVEELGLFGLTVIIFGYFIIIFRLFLYAFKTKSEGYKIILVGTGLYIFYHFALNVAGVSGLLPLTGVPLLFISSGGSSLLSIMILIGISQNVIARIRRQGSVSSRKKVIKKVGKAQTVSE